MWRTIRGQLCSITKGRGFRGQPRSSSDQAARFNSQVLANDEEAAAYIEREWQPDLIAKRYDWIFEYDALTAPLDVRAARVA